MRPSRLMRPSRSPLALAALCSVALLAIGCSSDDADDGGSNGSAASNAEALAELGGGYGLETYERLGTATSDLGDAVSDICSASSEQSLAVARDFYADARIALAAADAIWIGPAEDERSRSTIDPPVVPADIEQAISSIPADELNAEYVSSKVGATKRGLRTVEYLLFDAPVDPGQGGDASAVMSPERCRYAAAVAGSVADESEMLVGRWTTGDEIRKPYSTDIADPDNAEMTTGDLVTSQVTLLRNLADTQLSPALGRAGEAGQVDVSNIVEGGAEMGTDTMLTQVQSVRDVLVGPQGDIHFSGVLGEELSADLLADTEMVVNAGSAIDGSLRAAAISQPERVTDLYEAIEGLDATVSTQVVEKLGVSVGFSGGDGDGGS